MAEWALEVNGISKSFFGVRALSEVSLCVSEGQTLGLIGENGAGKSTLMNILGGVIVQDEGAITLFGEKYHPACPADATRAGIAFIHQELNTHRQAEELLTSVDLHIPPKTPIERLAPGEKQLVEIAKAMRRKSRIIIFDEPTTSLTAAERSRLFAIIKRLQDQSQTIIYISHTLEDVLQVSDSIAVLRDGCLVSAGARSEYTVNRMISDMVGRKIEQMSSPSNCKRKKCSASSV